MPYDSIISRDADLVPVNVASQVIQELPTASVMLQRARQVNLSNATQRMPVLDVLPSAYWVNGDTGLKQTSNQEWKGVDLIVEELAAIVPVPEAWLADSTIDIWGEVRPRMVEALGAAIDKAALFGTDKPSTWPDSIYLNAVAAGNAVVAGSGDDLAQDIAEVNRKVSEDGYAVNGFASKPGFMWQLVGMRAAATDGPKLPIFQPDLQGRPGGTLYGYPFNEVLNGSWDSGEALLITGDWSKAIIGLRQDITFKIFDQGVISDQSGNVVLNLMQQDAVAMRVVMRVAYALAKPATALASGALAARSPFGVLQATTANS